jgi:hypothetical protein
MQIWIISISRLHAVTRSYVVYRRPVQMCRSVSEPTLQTCLSGDEYTGTDLADTGNSLSPFIRPLRACILDWSEALPSFGRVSSLPIYYRNSTPVSN